MPSVLLLGVQVLKAGQVAAGDDEVHPLLVLDVEVAHRPATVVDDPEADRHPSGPAQRGILEDEAQAVFGHPQPAHGMLGAGLVMRVRGGGRVIAFRADRGTRERAAGEQHRQHAGECREPRRGFHAGAR